jgi:16S rRNA processing protein RimM
VGRIGRSYGLKGWVHVQAYTSDPKEIFQYDTWQLCWPNGKVQVYTFKEGRSHGGEGIVAHLVGSDDRDVARLLTGAEVQIAKHLLPELDDDAFYWTDLIGMQVDSKEGQHYGVVERIFDNGAHDVIAVKGTRERLIPLVIDDTVVDIDQVARKITVDWPEDA